MTKWNDEVIIYTLNLLAKAIKEDKITHLTINSPIIKKIVYELNQKFGNSNISESDLFENIETSEYKPISLLIKLWSISMDMGKSNYERGFVSYSKGENPEVIRKSKIINLNPIDTLGNIQFCIDTLSNKLSTTKNESSPKNQNTDTIKLETLTNLDILKTESGKYYDHLDEKYNLILSNDGTGSGKTRNVVINYIETFSNLLDNTKLHSLVIIVPQKNQFPKYSQECLANKIPELWARSQDDIVALETECLIGVNNLNSRTTLRDFFDKIFDIIDLKTGKAFDQILLKEHKERKKQTISSDDEFLFNNRTPSIEKCREGYKRHKLLTDLSEDGLNEKEKEELRSDRIKAKSYFMDSLSSLTEIGLVKHFTHENDFKQIVTDSKLDNINKSSNYDDKIKWLTKTLTFFLLPFEVSKHLNCIIYMTAHKSKQTFGHVVTNRNMERVVKRKYFEEITSNRSVQKRQNLIEALKFDEATFGNYLNESYFENVPTEEEINTTYSVMYDEEHATATKFLENFTYGKITTNYYDSYFNMVQAVVAVGKWVEEIDLPESPIMNCKQIKEGEREITRIFINNLKKYTEFNTDTKISEFFNFIKGNQDGIFVSASEHSLIKNICDNLLAFTPKLIMHKTQLEGLKLLGIPSGKHIIITSNPGLHNFEGATSTYSLYDLFTIALVLLYSCKDASKKLCSKYSELKSEDNQFAALSHCLTVAKNYKEFLENILNSHGTIDENQPINIQFAYFLKKVGFQLEFPDIINVDNYDDKYIKVTPQIFVLNEMTEVDILQILLKPGNKVFLLSATRGFNDIYAGNFSKDFFNKMDSILPDAVRVKERYNDKNVPNIMPELINERFNQRKSLGLEFVSFDKTTLSSKTETYSLKNILLNELDNSNNEQIFITTSTSSIASANLKVKFSKIIKDLTHLLHSNGIRKKFHQTEVTNAILSLFECACNPNQEHSMILGLTNNFVNKVNLIRSILGKTTNFGGYDSRKIFEWFYDPQNPKKRIRIICYDADLSKKNRLDDCFLVADEDTKIVLISSFQSAGTGLNFIINNNSDFNNIYILSDPHYSTVNNKDSGYSNNLNILLIIKSMAHKGTKTLNDLMNGLKGKDIREILVKEHDLEKTKTIMQAIGRTERRDTPIHSKIKIVDNGKNLKEIILGGFLKLYKIHAGETEQSILSNLSMNNKALLKSAILSNVGLTDNLRNKLINESSFKAKKTKECFEYIYGTIKPKYNSGDIKYFWFKDFNHIIRNYMNEDCDKRLDAQLLDFIEQNINVLSNKDKQTLISLKNNLYIDIKPYKNHPITLNTMENHYSDLSESNLIIDWDFIYGFGNLEDITWSEKNNTLIKKIIKWLNCFHSESNNQMDFIPNPYMLHILRGNRGEYLLEKIKSSLNIKNAETQFTIETKCKIYELFDSYFIVGNELICIDVKNWSLYSDDGIKKTIERYENKIATIENIDELKRYNKKYLYLNTALHKNRDISVNPTIHFNDIPNVRYLNLFLEKPTFNQNKVDNKIVSYENSGYNTIEINTELLKLLGKQ